MKRFYVGFALLLASLTFVFAQSQRNFVVMEISSGTWCVFCPGSAMGAKDMTSNNHKVAIIKHHGGDAYETPGSRERLNYYNVTSYPTTFFDGDNNLKISGGSANSSLYSGYRQAYNQAIIKSSPMEMSSRLVRVDQDNWILRVKVVQTGLNVPSSLSLQGFVTESKIPENWFNQTELGFVNRLKVTRSITMPGVVGDSVVTDLPIRLGNWNRSNLEFVSFVEDQSTKTIYQADKLTRLYDQMVLDFVKISELSAFQGCEAGEMNIRLENTSTEFDLTSITFEIEGENGSTTQDTWTGTLAPESSTYIQLPAPSTNTPNAVLRVTAMNPNGNLSTGFETDTLAVTVLQPLDEPMAQPVGIYVASIKPDRYGNQLTWEVADDNGNVLRSFGPYTNITTTKFESFTLENPGCYHITISDLGGDGLPGGFFVLRSLVNRDTLINLSEFGSRVDLEWRALPEDSFVSVRPRLDANLVQVTPNPSAGELTVEVQQNRGGAVDLTLTTLTGQAVQALSRQTSAGTFRQQLYLNDLSAGIYLLRIRTEAGEAVRKVVRL